MNDQTLLYVDASLRPAEESRTAQLCETYLDTFLEVHPGARVERLPLRELDLRPNGMEDIARRDACVQNGEWDHPCLQLARSFAQADHILIGAPYWDLSFPSLLKVYWDKVCLGGVTFVYTASGPKSLCRAERLTYLTACGGFIGQRNFGAEYVRELSAVLFGITDFYTEAAEGLDIAGADVSAILSQARRRVRRLAEDA
jgi:FMN-dependent NADH-azoreductase